MDIWTDKDGNEYMLAVGGYLYKRVYDPDGEDNPDDIEIGHVHQLEALRQQLQAAKAELEEYRTLGTFSETVKQLGYLDMERDRLAAELETAREACVAALEYDKEIQRVSSLGKSWVGGNRLDELYSDWINKARAALRLQPRQPDADEPVAGTA